MHENTTLSLLPAFLALACLVPPCFAQGESLERVRPAPSLEESSGGSGERHLFDSEFDRDEWIALLSEPDLARRERSFELLLRRARLDPMARGFLEVLSTDGTRPDLAWTARLALRELRRTPFLFEGLLPSAGLLPTTDAFRQPFTQDVDGLLEELLRQGRFAVPLPPPGGLIDGSGRDRDGGLPGRAGVAQRRVEVRQTREGAVIEIFENVEGTEERKTYEGESLEDILAHEPDLERELGARIRGLAGGGNFRLHFLAPGSGAFDAWAPFLAPQARSQPIRADKLGVRAAPVTTEHARELGLDSGAGLYCLLTAPGTIAHLFGVKRGDVLLELNGIPLRSREDISIALLARSPEDPIRLVWIDGLGQRRSRDWTPPR